MFLHVKRMVLSALVLIIISACSNSEEQAEKGRLEQTTDKIAQEAIDSIKTPIAQAQLAKELTEQHNSVVLKNINQ